MSGDAHAATPEAESAGRLPKGMEPPFPGAVVLLRYFLLWGALIGAAVYLLYQSRKPTAPELPHDFTVEQAVKKEAAVGVAASHTPKAHTPPEVPVASVTLDSPGEKSFPDALLPGQWVRVHVSGGMRFKIRAPDNLGYQVLLENGDGNPFEARAGIAWDTTSTGTFYVQVRAVNQRFSVEAW